MTGNKKEKRIWGWEDCCPSCGTPNIDTNKCAVCDFKWKKGCVYFSNTSIADWSNTKNIEITLKGNLIKHEGYKTLRGFVSWLKKTNVRYRKIGLSELWP